MPVLQIIQKKTGPPDNVRVVFFPPVIEYLQMLVDAGANLDASQISVDMMLDIKDIVDRVIYIANARDFIDRIENARILFIQFQDLVTENTPAFSLR